MSVGKERVKREFAADDGQVDILVCTDSASEGLNLQECGALINYELPWNPMRVEQRIGRIDRIGQQYDDITILNYRYKDTIETRIYDRADSRINLFESVVGEMQPILSSVNQQIRSAALEADDAEQAVEQADKEFEKQIEEQESGERVDVGESLDSVDEVLAQDVIDEAKLTAWQSYEHPDIEDVGAESYEYPTPFVTSGVEEVVVGNETLEANGVEFTPVSELNESEDLEGFSFASSTYRLDYGNAFSQPAVESVGTIAEAIAPGEETVAVTFSAECADEFPSVQYLAPGHPLLTQLIRLLKQESEEAPRLTRTTQSRETGEAIPIVAAWGREGEFGRVNKAGDVVEDASLGSISAWCDAFIENREKASDQ